MIFLERVVAIAVLTCAAPVVAADPIPPERRIDWSAAGVPGGIPERTDVCATIDAATYGTMAVDATAAIQQAIDECPTSVDAPAVVVIPAGDYLIGSRIDLGQKSYLTVRGAGASRTRLVSAERTFTLGIGTESPLAATVTSGATKGSTQMTVSSIEGITVDGLLKIDRNDDPTLVHATSGPGRHISQMLLVTSINGNDIEFEPALFWDFDDAPQLYGYGGIITRGTGIENLAIDHEGGAKGPSIFIEQCYGCWARGISSHMPLEYHNVSVNNLNCEIRDSYFHDSQTHGHDNGGVVLYGTNTAWKIENNIFFKTFPGIECQYSTSANYFGYNFGAQVEAGWEHSGAMYTDNHGAHDMMNLWEGNTGEMFQSDGYYGSGSHGTLFRNHFTAQNPAKIGNFKAISLDRWSYFYNVIGNVLGGPGTTYTYYEADIDNYPFEHPTIYRLGYPNLGNNGFGSDGASPNGIDAMVRDTLLRVGNYDYFHECVWDDAAGACLDAAASFALELPDSLYYDAEPAWWPSSKAWPPFVPDRDGFAADAPTKIPAHDCFELLDLANGGVFDADLCNADDGGGTAGSDEAGSDGAADTSGGNGSAATVDDGPGGTMAGGESGDASSAGQNGDGDGGCSCTHGAWPRDRSSLLLFLLAMAHRSRANGRAPHRSSWC